MQVNLGKFLHSTLSGKLGPKFTFIRSKSVSVIDVPFSRGQPKSGVEKGPDAIRSTNVLEDLKSYGFTICHSPLDQSDLSEEKENVALKAKNIHSVVKMAKVLSQHVKLQLSTAEKAIVLGGDHSIALGSITGHAMAKGDICVIWIDAHAGESSSLGAYK